MEELKTNFDFFQTLISAVISAFMVILGILIKEYFDRNSSKRNYIRDKGYHVHERLRDNLRRFLRDGIVASLSTPKKVRKEDEDELNISFSSFKKQFENGFFLEITLYSDVFKDFEKDLLEDIRKVSKLSIPRIQKTASELEDCYEETKEGEAILSELFLEQFYDNGYDVDHVITPMEKTYTDYINEAHKKIFWIKASALLLRLERDIEKVVKLEV
jgi:hypothetical protein